MPRFRSALLAMLIEAIVALGARSHNAQVLPQLGSAASGGMLPRDVLEDIAAIRRRVEHISDDKVEWRAVRGALPSASRELSHQGNVAGPSRPPRFIRVENAAESVYGEAKMHHFASGEGPLQSDAAAWPVRTVGGATQYPRFRGRGTAGLVSLRKSGHGALKMEADLKLSVEGLPSRSGGCKPDPFAVLYLREGKGLWTRAGETEVQKQSDSLTWSTKISAPFPFTSTQPIRVDVYDGASGNTDSLASHTHLARVETTLSTIVGSRTDSVKLTLKCEDKRQGSITIESESHNTATTLLEYVLGGLELQMGVGIDFTGSNGKPTRKSSHHYLKAPGGSPYERAVEAFGKILLKYDHDKEIVTLGYGGKFDGKLSFSHPITSDGKPAHGLDELKRAYHRTVNSVTLWGPTRIATLIDKEVEGLTCTQSVQRYKVILIITDGLLSDMDKAKSAIIRASELPVSIVLVGVGNANFDRNIQVLDSDNKLLRNRAGDKAERDIVQFVRFKDFANDAKMLEQETLEEVPRQVEEYMEKHGIRPNSKPASLPKGISDDQWKWKWDNQRPPEGKTCKMPSDIQCPSSDGDSSGGDSSGGDSSGGDSSGGDSSGGDSSGGDSSGGDSSGGDSSGGDSSGGDSSGGDSSGGDSSGGDSGGGDSSGGDSSGGSGSSGAGSGSDDSGSGSTDPASGGGGSSSDSGPPWWLSPPPWCACSAHPAVAL